MPKVKSSRAHKSTIASHPYSFVRSETNLFEEPVFDVSLSATIQTGYHSVTSLSEHSSPIDFFIQANDSHFIDLSETKLYVKAKIVSETGTALRDDDIVAPANNFLHSLFQQVSIQLNGVQITS